MISVISVTFNDFVNSFTLNGLIQKGHQITVKSQDNLNGNLVKNELLM